MPEPSAQHRAAAALTVPRPLEALLLERLAVLEQVLRENATLLAVLEQVFREHAALLACLTAEMRLLRDRDIPAAPEPR